MLCCIVFFAPLYLLVFLLLHTVTNVVGSLHNMCVCIIRSTRYIIYFLFLVWRSGLGVCVSICSLRGIASKCFCNSGSERCVQHCSIRRQFLIHTRTVACHTLIFEPRAALVSVDFCVALRGCLGRVPCVLRCLDARLVEFYDREIKFTIIELG